MFPYRRVVTGPCRYMEETGGRGRNWRAGEDHAGGVTGLLAQAIHIADASRPVLAAGNQRQPKTEREGVGSRKIAIRFCLVRHQCMSLSFRYTKQNLTSGVLVASGTRHLQPTPDG